MERGLAGTAVGTAGPKDAGGVRARAAELADRYEALVERTEAIAVGWRWATPTSGRGDVEPLRLERMGCSPGRWLDRPPPPWREHQAVGFDVLGRVVCVREYDATGEVWLERFTVWGAEGAEITCFRAPLDWEGACLPAELQAFTHVRLAGGLPVASERYLPPTGSCSRERYRHEGARLTRVEEDACDDGGGLVTVVKEVVYGDDGGVERIDALEPYGRRVVWRRQPRPHATRHGARLGGGRLRRQVCA